MTYLRYANICADLMRGVLKEPFKTKAMQRQAIYFRSAPWADGKQGTSGACQHHVVSRRLAAHDVLAAVALVAGTAAEAAQAPHHAP
jgi:hypothetical protein